MDTKDFKVRIPKEYEIDTENSTSEYIRFKSKNKAYGEVVQELFSVGNIFFINSLGTISEVKYSDRDASIKYSNNGTSKKQLEKLLAINKLMNVAKYLNGGWKPNWDDYSEKKWSMALDDENISIAYNYIFCELAVYFRSKESAEQAIKILGEDTIKLAFSTDW